MSENDKLSEALEAIKAEPTELIHKWRVLEILDALAASKPEASPQINDEQRRVLIEVAQMFAGQDRRREVLNSIAGLAPLSTSPAATVASKPEPKQCGYDGGICNCPDGYCQNAHSKPEPQAQAAEPEVVADGSGAFGCSAEASGGVLCNAWCGGQTCPTTSPTPVVDSSTEAYRAYAENLPGANDYLTDSARKRLEEAANFCLSPRPNFEPKRNRGSDDGYYEHAEASRLWWAFSAGMNYKEKLTREAIAKRDAALDACVESEKGEHCPACPDQGWYVVADNRGEAQQEQCEFCYTNPRSIFNLRRAAITQAQEARK